MGMRGGVRKSRAKRRHLAAQVRLRALRPLACPSELALQAEAGCILTMTGS